MASPARRTGRSGRTETGIRRAMSHRAQRRTSLPGQRAAALGRLPAVAPDASRAALGREVVGREGGGRERGGRQDLGRQVGGGDAFGRGGLGWGAGGGAPSGPAGGRG